MNHTPQINDDFEELAGLMKASFPEISCLRCGFDRFYVLPDAPAPRLADGPLTDSRHPVLSLACVRCGHIEQHLTGVLRSASKPIAETR